MIKGVIGFSYIESNLYGTMLIVRGKRVINVILPIGIYGLMRRLWSSKNILGKFLFDKPNWQVQLERAKSSS